jgi:hypothetical protein
MNFEIFNETRGPPGPPGTPALLNVNSILLDSSWTFGWSGFDNDVQIEKKFFDKFDYAIIEETEKTIHFTGQIKFNIPSEGISTQSRSLTLSIVPPVSLQDLLPPVKPDGPPTSQIGYYPGCLNAIVSVSDWHVQGSRISTATAPDVLFVFQMNVSSVNLTGSLELSWTLIYQKA